MESLKQIEFGRRPMPSLLQTEAMECGLACLAMVACHHGFRTDLPTLRSRFSVSLAGTTMALIVGYADQINLSGRVLRLELEEAARPTPTARPACRPGVWVGEVMLLKSAIKRD